MIKDELEEENSNKNEIIQNSKKRKYCEIDKDDINHINHINIDIDIGDKNINQSNTKKKKYSHNNPNNSENTNPLSPVKYKISLFYYINSNKLTIQDLKDGRRIFNNKTQFISSSNNGNFEFKENFIDFQQLFYENLLLNKDFTEKILVSLPQSSPAQPPATGQSFGPFRFNCKPSSLTSLCFTWSI